jgi:hypothetical protein
MVGVEWDLQAGDVIKRTQLHDRFGGSRQGGMAPSTTTPNILIFTDPAVGGIHGYHDRWDGPVLAYVGEGQRGDQKMTAGNKALLEHRQTGRSVRVFRGAGGDVLYLGAYVLDEPAWDWDFAPETGGGPMRKVIRFRLRPARVASVPPEPSRRRDYRRANEAPQTTPALPFAPDPNEVDRSLAAHATTQNALRDFLATRNIEVWSPGALEPDFDLAWRRKGVVWVGEIKSLGPTNETQQLRLGLGQVLDYQDTFLITERHVRAALVVSRPPSDRRWVDLCLRHGVVLVWPGTFEELLH